MRTRCVAKGVEVGSPYGNQGANGAAELSLDTRPETTDMVVQYASEVPFRED